jgi:tRNA1(Val) A37 N6-methylase TrmN6
MLMTIKSRSTRQPSDLIDFNMHELVRTNNAVLISAIEALLNGADIRHVVLDRHMSVLEGSLGILPRRILVGEDDWAQARQLLEDAGLAHELRTGQSGQGSEKTIDRPGTTEDRPDMTDDRPGMTDDRPDMTEDHVLGGRLKIRQNLSPHRVGHDAILLGAAVGALAGDRAVEFGTGVGAGGLALAARVPGVDVTLLEIDPELSALATENISLNNLADRVTALTLDVTGSAAEFAACGISPGSADHVLMNPPFNDPSRHRASPDPRRSAAHMASGNTLSSWIDAASRVLHSAGTLTLIWRADGLKDVLAALDERFGGIHVLPIHGRAGEPAIRILLSARKGSRAPLALLPGLALNDKNGTPTAQAEAILRHGEALVLGGKPGR